MKKGKDGFYCKYVKRILDIVCALTAMIVFCWLYAIIAVLVRLKLGNPVIFKQQRPGRIDPETGKERIFTLYKFRSMTDERNENGNLLSDEVRLTKFGRFLRSTSLDELPEIINILKGEMSFIGPRPLLTEYLPYYTEEERHRHDVRPGLSGLAQISGRNSITWEGKFDNDLNYIHNLSFGLDAKTVLKTIFKVIKQNDVLVGKEHIVADLNVERLMQNDCKAHETI